VQQLRGTRKGGGVFEAAGKARARYLVVILLNAHFALMQNEPKNQDLLKLL
jgi:hypothetical protein